MQVQVHCCTTPCASPPFPQRLLCTFRPHTLPLLLLLLLLLCALWIDPLCSSASSQLLASPLCTLQPGPWCSCCRRRCMLLRLQQPRWRNSMAFVCCGRSSLHRGRCCHQSCCHQLAQQLLLLLLAAVVQHAHLFFLMEGH